MWLAVGCTVALVASANIMKKERNLTIYFHILGVRYYNKKVLGGTLRWGIACNRHTHYFTFCTFLEYLANVCVQCLYWNNFPYFQWLKSKPMLITVKW